ncbi:polysaccharide deacetylase family protein [Kitasatospora sp. MAP5-34]|uniref:polysaccharide deacetylase family protein n=1 Tax=Kitasatospora sp. MAP5-34 TaxID=3035102 RepID=UPI002475B829|nr:polysaccharide deacetylase family protein [Kitasatospora sp. MAP5-34]MDH6578084.1 peptidoglycan/xylan/chitin deacetylase (PgdA/CDA1 family) [Kitasatospora sp. MAP5-34]
MKSRTKTYAVGALALLAAVAGCSSSAAPAAHPAAPPEQSSQSADAPSGSASASGGPQAAAWSKWGLQPLPPAPAPPTDRPIKLTASGTVPVISSVPTKDKIVFITLDDGAEKDPKFIEMMNDLKIPVTMFLTKNIIENDYGYFKPLQALGNHIQNHTVTHPIMSKISAAKQKSEICVDQATLTQQYGTAPLLFRPPYGDGANTPTLNTSVQECGPRAIVLWHETMQIHDMQYVTADKKLRPGDIILAHFRGPSELKGETMTAMFGEMLSRIQEQGFAVARLDDYIQPPTG